MHTIWYDAVVVVVVGCKRYNYSVQVIFQPWEIRSMALITHC